VRRKLAGSPSSTLVSTFVPLTADRLTNVVTRADLEHAQHQHATATAGQSAGELARLYEQCCGSAPPVQALRLLVNGWRAFFATAYSVLGGGLVPCWCCGMSPRRLYLDGNFKLWTYVVQGFDAYLRLPGGVMAPPMVLEAVSAAAATLVHAGSGADCGGAQHAAARQKGGDGGGRFDNRTWSGVYAATCSHLHCHGMLPLRGAETYAYILVGTLLAATGGSTHVTIDILCQFVRYVQHQYRVDPGFADAIFKAFFDVQASTRVRATAPLPQFSIRLAPDEDKLPLPARGMHATVSDGVPDDGDSASADGIGSSNGQGANEDDGSRIDSGGDAADGAAGAHGNDCGRRDRGANEAPPATGMPPLLPPPPAGSTGVYELWVRSAEGATSAGSAHALRGAIGGMHVLAHECADWTAAHLVPGMGQNGEPVEQFFARLSAAAGTTHTMGEGMWTLFWQVWTALHNARLNSGIAYTLLTNVVTRRLRAYDAAEAYRLLQEQRQRDGDELLDVGDVESIIAKRAAAAHTPDAGAAAADPHAAYIKATDKRHSRAREVAQLAAMVDAACGDEVRFLMLFNGRERGALGRAHKDQAPITDLASANARLAYLRERLQRTATAAPAVVTDPDDLISGAFRSLRATAAEVERCLSRLHPHVAGKACTRTRWFTRHVRKLVCARLHDSLPAVGLCTHTTRPSLLTRPVSAPTTPATASRRCPLVTRAAIDGRNPHPIRKDLKNARARIERLLSLIASLLVHSRIQAVREYHVPRADSIKRAADVPSNIGSLEFVTGAALLLQHVFRCVNPSVRAHILNALHVSRLHLLPRRPHPMFACRYVKGGRARAGVHEQSATRGGGAAHVRRHRVRGAPPGGCSG